MTQITPRRISPAAARSLTDTIKADVEKLWRLLVSAYDQGAHTALGYASWHAYCKTEFGTGTTHSYQLLNAGKVAKALDKADFAIAKPSSEGVVRELVPVQREKGDEAVAETWHEVVETHGPNPTAEQTREVVREKGGVRRVTKRGKLTPDQQRFTNALSALRLNAEYVSLALAGKTNDEKAALAALLDVDKETFTQWVDCSRAADNAARQLKRRVLERRAQR